MSYLIRCDQCQREIPKNGDYWSLMPHRNKESYSIEELDRRDPDFCSDGCLLAWLAANPLPAWPTETLS